MLRCAPRCSPRLLALALLTLGTLTGLTACADDPIAPATPPATPPGVHGGRVLGLVEVSLSGIGTSDLQASERAVTAGDPAGGPGTTASGLRLTVSPVPGGDGSIQLAPVSTGSFTEGTRGVDGERYLYATFRVRNAQADGTAYTDARTNLTFLGVETASTLNATAISTLQRFDGSAADPAIAPQVLPTGAVHQVNGQRTSTEPDVLQLLSEADAASVTAPAGVTSVLPYGFVVQNPNARISTVPSKQPGSRVLPANPAPDQFDGVVTFAFKMPLQASSAADPFTISAMFLAVDDDTTRLTQSLEEQDPAATLALEARAKALRATSLTLLPGGTAFLGSGAERVLCTVRVAGPAGSPTATLDLPARSEPWLVPAPLGRDAQFLPRTISFAAALCPGIKLGSLGRFVVQGFQSEQLIGSPTLVDASLTEAPAGSFFPGEEVEVTLTTTVGGTTPVVARYRVAASAGPGAFTTTSSPAVGSNPLSVTAADLDGDGDLDLATANEGAGTVSILLNDGTGTFTTASSPAVGGEPEYITAADLDGDGDLDLAVANGISNTISILLNDGTGTFTIASSPAVGLDPFSVTAADLDGDGDLDLTVANLNANTVSILRNDGTGTFTLASSPAVGGRPVSVTAADVDGDGDLDLAVANFDDNTLSILLNDGTGTFTTASSPAVGLAPRSVTAADLDGDGDLDLAVANQNASTVSILKNQ